MDVVIAAAGKGSRLRQEANDKHKALFEIDGKALIAHTLDRLLDTEEVARLVVVGAEKSPDAEQVYEYLNSYAQQFGVDVHLVTAERRGMGHALWIGSKSILEGDSSARTLLMPCDTILKTYVPLLSHVDAVLGTVPIPDGPCKYSILSCSQNGSIDLSSDKSNQVDFQNKAAFLGVFSLSRRSLEKFEELASAIMNGELELPNTWNSANEMRISWLWPELAKIDHSIRAVNVEGFAELNTPTQIPYLEGFIREQMNSRPETEI